MGLGPLGEAGDQVEREQTEKRRRSRKGLPGKSAREHTRELVGVTGRGREAERFLKVAGLREGRQLWVVKRRGRVTFENCYGETEAQRSRGTLPQIIRLVKQKNRDSGSVCDARGLLATRRWTLRSGDLRVTSPFPSPQAPGCLPQLPVPAQTLQTGNHSLAL